MRSEVDVSEKSVLPTHMGCGQEPYSPLLPDNAENTRKCAVIGNARVTPKFERIGK
jgi:hypothetical protein